MLYEVITTNDAITSALRLMDMGAPGYMVASALRAIVAQRLVRRVCRDCAQPHEPEPGAWTWLESLFGPSARQHSRNNFV